MHINGARRTANNYLVDGISNNDRYYGDSVLNQTGVVGVPATLVPPDAIQEVTIQQTPSAEFGVKGGAPINVVMKSGTNSCHGSAHWFRHTDVTDARNFFSDKVTPLKNNQFGGTLGGPIVKDKLFFFTYYEGQRLSVLSPFQAPTIRADQVAAARAAITAAGLTTSPFGENLLKFFPILPANPSQPLGNVSTINTAIPNIANMDTFGVKIDYRLGDKHLIAARYFFGDSTQSAPAFAGEIAPPGNPGLFNSIAPTRAQLSGITWTWNLGPTKILESRVGFTRIAQIIDVNNKIDPKSLGADTGPLDPIDFGVPALYSSIGYIGGVGGYPITTRPNQNWEIQENFTWTHGNHTMKMGGNFQRATTFSLRNRARTVFDIFPGDALQATEQLLTARFDDAGRSFGSTRRYIFQNSLGAYWMDDWKVHPRLSVNFGLRYDISGALGEKNNVGANFFPSRGLVKLGQGIDRLYDMDKNNVGPRVGFAWDPWGDGKTAIRAGYALTYDIPNFGSIHAPRTAFVGGSRAGAFTQPNLGIFAVGLNGDLTTTPVDPAATCLNPNNPGAGGDFVCVLAGQPIYGTSPSGSPPFNAFSARNDLQTPMTHYFNVSMQHEVFRNNAFTIAYVGARGRDLLVYRDLNARPLGGGARPFAAQFPTLAHIIQLTNDSISNYDSMQVTYRQRDWHGINTQYTFTWGNCRDIDSINRGSRSNFPQAQNPYNPKNSYGPCDHDIRRNFNVAGAYAIPRIPGIGKFAGAGWELATVFTALDGRPFTPGIGSRDRSGQDVHSIRANWNGTPVQYNTRDPNHYIANPQVFSTPASGKLGNAGRNMLRGAGLNQWDLSLVKHTNVTEKTEVQFRWEVYNVLNRANFGPPQSTNIRSSLFGTIADTWDVDAGNPGIAQGGPRYMSFVLKVKF